MFSSALTMEPTMRWIAVVVGGIALVAGICWYNAHLHTVVAQARADEKHARDAEQQAVEKHRLAHLRLQAQTRLHAGRTALAAGDGRPDVSAAMAPAGSEARTTPGEPTRPFPTSKAT